MARALVAVVVGALADAGAGPEATALFVTRPGGRPPGLFFTKTYQRNHPLIPMVQNSPE